MPTNITMPALSPTMEEGTLAKWLVKEGDTVEAGDVIAEIETDKATMEVEAVDEGRLGKILIAEGTENVKVNEPIAVLLEEGESEDDIDSLSLRAESPDKIKSEAIQTKSDDAESQKDGLPRRDTAPRNDAENDGTRIFASPLARRMANQQGIDLSAIQGSGPKGRIVKADIESAGQPTQQATQASPSSPSSPSQQAGGAVSMPSGPDAKSLADAYGMSYTAEKNSGMRKTIAKRLLESKQTVPHYYLSIECQIDALLAARKQMNDKADGAYKLSVNDFLVKACAMALKAYPKANVAWTDEEMLYFEHSDISVAVATPTGLITPIVKKAENKGLVDISNEVKDLAGRARDGKLKPEEYQGGTFSISNLGMFGIDEFSAIINPPQSCIFAVGAGTQKPYVDNGDVKIGTFMKGVLSCDHRSVDGAVGAEFLKILKDYIENPVSMLL